MISVGRIMAVAVAGAACVGAAGTFAAAAEPRAVLAPSRSAGSTVAKVMVRARVASAPGARDTIWTAATETDWGAGAQWLLVLRSAVASDGRLWLAVELPVRPNAKVGWIRADYVLVRHTPWWVRVSLRRREVTVYRHGTEVRRFGAVVGASATPTPRGLFAIHDPVRQRDAGGFLGPWALHLTAVSNVLDDYGGGPGRVAIHGRGGDSLRDPLGSARSHGCIRVDNAEVRWLARHLPRGTPVSIGVSELESE